MSPRRPRLRSLGLADSWAGLRGETPDAVIVVADPLAGATADLATLVAGARDHARQRHVIVRLSSLASGRVDAELDAWRPAWPDAVLLPDCADGRDVQHAGVKLAVREACLGVPAGSTAIMAALGPAGFLAASRFRGVSDRLAGLTWDRAALEADLGTACGAFESASDADATAVLRTLLRLGAQAAGVAAYDAAGEAVGAAFAADCRRARDLGFEGKIARDARQIAAIHAAFPLRGPFGVTAGG